MTYYMNKYTGELLTYDEMLKQAEEEYDALDETNMLYLDDYYDRIKIDTEATQ